METISSLLVGYVTARLGSTTEVGAKALEGAVPPNETLPLLNDFRAPHFSPARIAPSHREPQRGPRAIGFRLPSAKFPSTGSFNRKGKRRNLKGGGSVGAAKWNWIASTSKSSARCRVTPGSRTGISHSAWG